MRRVVQGLEWRRLGGLLWVSDSALDEISKEHTTDDEREAAVIHHWMLHDPLASWRRLLHCLYMSDESDRADSITHYAEELTGMIMLLYLYVYQVADVHVHLCFSLAHANQYIRTLISTFSPFSPLIDSSLTQLTVVKVLEGIDMERIDTCLVIPCSVGKKLAEQSESEEERRNKLVDWWLKTSPYASWQWLSGFCHFWVEESVVSATKSYTKRAPGIMILSQAHLVYNLIVQPTQKPPLPLII